MPAQSLYVETFKSKYTLTVFGVICINKETLDQASLMATQNMDCDEAHLLALEQSILEHGYNPSFPITLNEIMRTIDGYSRMMACIRIVRRGDMEEIYIPFYTADGEQADYNGSTRGVSAVDIQYLFRIPRHGGLLTGSAKRGAEQAIEASQMLDVSKLDGDFDKAFDSTRVQRHTSKIVREQETFARGYRAVCELATDLDLNPDHIKWAHWLALFCRHGVNNSTKSVARRYVIENKGTTQATRHETFKKASVAAVELGSL